MHNEKIILIIIYLCCLISLSNSNLLWAQEPPPNPQLQRAAIEFNELEVFPQFQRSLLEFHKIDSNIPRLSRATIEFHKFDTNIPRLSRAAIEFHRLASNVSITRLYPSKGCVNGGTAVTIVGSGFSNSDLSVRFGQIVLQRQAFTILDDKMILAFAPAGTGTVGVFISDDEGESPIAANAQFTYATFPGTIDFQLDAQPTLTFEPFDLWHGDFNNDGLVDLAVVDEDASKLFIFRNTSQVDGALSFVADIQLTTGTAPRGVTVGDFNQDGKLDIATTNFGSNNVSVFKNQTAASGGTISFAAQILLPGLNSPYNLLAVDFDNDGWSDIAFTNFFSSTLSVYRNTSANSNGEITFDTANRLDVLSSNGPVDVTYGDFNQDGKVDLVTADNLSGVVSIFENKSTVGIILFERKRIINTGAGPHNITNGDFNGDGLMDFAIVNFSPNVLTVFKNSGGVNFNFNKTTFSLPGGPHDLTFGDFDCDGLQDIAIASFSSQELTIMKNVTSKTSIQFEEAGRFAANFLPHAVTYSDFNNDGRVDVATADAAGPTISIFRNKSINEPGVTIGQPGGNTSVEEGGITDSLQVRLNAQPLANTIVTVDLRSGPQISLNSLGANSTVRLIFDSSNWNVIQNVTVSAVDDSVVEDVQSGLITGSVFSDDSRFAVLTIDDIPVAIADNDFDDNIVLITPDPGGATVSEQGTTTTDYTLKLNITPTLGDVTLLVTPDSQAEIAEIIDPNDPSEIVNFSTTAIQVTFKFINGDITKTVRVRAINDAIAEGSPHAGTIQHSITANSGDNTNFPTTAVISDFQVQITDNDTAAVLIVQSNDETNVREGDLKDSYSIELVTRPRAQVEITILSNEQVEIFEGDVPDNPMPASSKTLTFSFNENDWNIPQLITVFAANDTVDELFNHEGSIVHSATSDDPIYNGILIESVTVNIEDNDGGPTISNVYPKAGSVRGGTAIKIIGTNFNNPRIESVTFAGVEARSFFVISNTEMLVFTSPNLGSANIQVVNAENSAVLIDGFEFKTFPGSIIFSRVKDLTINVLPEDVLAADFDNDGFEDIAVTDIQFGTVSVFRNTFLQSASINFSAPFTFNVGLRPLAIAAGDLDADGLLDIVTVDSFSRSLSVLRNRSAGPGSIAFDDANRVILPFDAFMVELELADFDNDGRMDIAVVSSVNQKLIIFRNISPAPGAFLFDTDNPFQLETEGFSNDITFGDYNDDNKLDLAIVNRMIGGTSNGKVTLYQNTSSTGSISFIGRHSIDANMIPEAITNGDFNNDGFLDSAVVSAERSPVLTIFKTSDSGNFKTRDGEFVLEGRPIDVTMTDVDNDGFPDFATASTTGEMIIYRNEFVNNNKIPFVKAGAFIGPGSLIEVVHSDFDNDGRMDIVTVSQSTSLVSVFQNLSETAPGITLIETGGDTQVTEGLVSDSYSVVLNTQPTADVFITITPDVELDLGNGVAVPVKSTFTVNDWDIPQIITVNAYEDMEVEVLSVVSLISHTVFSEDLDFNDVDVRDVSVTVTDVDVDAGFVEIIHSGDGVLRMFEDPNLMEGESDKDTYIVKLSIAPDSGTQVGIRLTHNGTDITVTPSFLEFNSETTEMTVTVMATSDDQVETSPRPTTISHTFDNTGLSNPDPRFVGAISPVVAFVDDDDSAQIIFKCFTGDDEAMPEVACDIQTQESNVSDIYFVTLSSLPIQDVNIAITDPSGQLEFSLDEVEEDLKVFTDVVNIIFAGETEPLPQRISVRSKDDLIDEAFKIPVNIQHNVTSSDPFYDGQQKSLSAISLDNDGGPTVTRISPSNGPIAGNTLVTIIGEKFISSPINQVTFGNVIANQFVVIDDTKIEVISPAQGVGEVTVTVTSPENSSPDIGDANDFTYVEVDQTISFTIAQQTFGGVGAAEMAQGDFNNDGLPDLVIANQGGENSRVSLLRNSDNSEDPPPGSIPQPFFGRVFIRAGVTPSDIVTADFDGDGLLDMATADTDDNTVSIYRNGTDTSIPNIDPVFNFRKLLNTGDQPTGITAVDLDGDGRPEIAITNLADNTISIYRNLSTPETILFAAPLTLGTGFAPIDIEFGDFNGDGKVDLAVCERDSNAVAFYQNSSSIGSLSLVRTKVIVDNLAPTRMTRGDFNADGKPDLAVVNPTTNKITLYQNRENGNGRFSFATGEITFTGAPIDLAIGDFNNDGLPDFAVVTSLNRLVIVKNTTRKNKSSFVIDLSLQTGLNPFAVIIGDYNEDGQLDIATADRDSNVITIFTNDVIPVSTSSSKGSKK